MQEDATVVQTERAEPTIADFLQRPLRDLRISITDRCNLRCTYWRVGRDYGNFGRNGIKVLNCNKKRKRQLGEFD